MVERKVTLGWEREHVTLGASRGHALLEVATPCLSSWGEKGYGDYWCNGSNAWLYRHLHKAAERMVESARRFPEARGLRRRALNQAAREVMLESSASPESTTRSPPSVFSIRKKPQQAKALGALRGRRSDRVQRVGPAFERG